MKRLAAQIILALVFALTLSKLFIHPIFAIDGFIKFTNPTGGETLNVGQNYTIRWDSSSNIDKVNIGYKSCDSCLDWVVFTTPNTGSYNWNVNVGNTTNTTFWLSITGYETGKGSLTSYSGKFTVNGGYKAPTSAPSNPTPPSSGGSTIIRTPSGSRRIYMLPTPTPRPTTIPTPTPIPLTLTTIHLSSTFIFEGSQTTDLTKITDPKHVEHFTIDTKYHWTMVFTEEIDLTDKKKLAMLRDMDKYWVVEWWFVWIHIEWWEVFDTPCEITVKNDNLTGFKPNIVTSETKPVVKESTPSGTPKPTGPVFKQGKSGEVVLGLTDAGKIEIKPNVQFKNKPTKPVSTDTIALTGETSHKNLLYQLMVNGQESSISADIKNDGSFPIKVPKLVEGANYIELSYKEASDSGFTKADSVSVTYKPNNMWMIIAGIGATVVLLVAGVITFIVLQKKHILHFSFKLPKKKKLEE